MKKVPRWGSVAAAVWCQLIPGLVIGMSGFAIGVWAVDSFGYQPPVIAIPIYVVFALVLGQWLMLANKYFGYGHLDKSSYPWFLLGHLGSFAATNSLYAAVLYSTDWNYQLVALPLLCLTLIISTVVNNRLLRT